MLSENVLRANGSDGSTNVFATPSGMVGTPNAIGAWYFWMPAEGVIFDAEYWGMRVTITRDSGNTYLYSPDGGASMSSHQYAARWRGAQYFDVAGRAINSPADATDTRDPSQISGNKFLELGPANVPDVAAPPGSGSPNPDMWTRASDGDTSTYPSPSGMVGRVNDSGAWYMFVPPAGVTYDAQYWGMRVSLLNNGDGSYMLAVDGQRSAHVYADKWKPGQYYDYKGSRISSISRAKTVADPSDVYFETGQYLTAPPPSTAVVPPTAGPAQPPVITQPGTTPTPSPIVTRPPTASPAQPPVITRPPVTVNPLPYTPVPTLPGQPSGGGVSPIAPSPAPAPPLTFPGPSSQAGATSWWPVLAAGAALLLLKRKR